MRAVLLEVLDRRIDLALAGKRFMEAIRLQRVWCQVAGILPVSHAPVTGPWPASNRG
jgi:hypothetical protein